ncbi:hypothetical protein AVEN_71462-1 [Araneus ventricosus]|uniref:Uncharacterized protein n=1 Tax=Araneus ventricosus TaxID=182803 RepID=A0A4Y2CUH1_ARAVE|nr:hypothetical protein AVEN_71462-1 [Araneus ventricosus]
MPPSRRQMKHKMGIVDEEGPWWLGGKVSEAVEFETRFHQNPPCMWTWRTSRVVTVKQNQQRTVSDKRGDDSRHVEGRGGLVGSGQRVPAPKPDSTTEPPFMWA